MLGHVDWWIVTSILRIVVASTSGWSRLLDPEDKALLSSEKSMSYAYLPADINIHVLLHNFVVEYRSVTATLKVGKKFL